MTTATIFSTDLVPALFTPRLAGPTTCFRCLSGGRKKGPRSLGLGAGRRPHEGGGGSILHGEVPELELQRYVKDEKYLQSVELLRYLVAKGHFPEDWLCAKLINGLLSTRNLSKAVEVIEVLESYGNPGPRAYSALIHGYVRAKKTHNACRVFDRMVASGVSPNAFAYDAMIKGLAQNGSLEDAMRFYKEMLWKGFKPNDDNYVHLIEANISQRGGGGPNWEEVLKLLEEMTLMGVQPSEMIYQAIATGLCKQGNPDRGLEFFWKIGDLGFPPSVAHCADMISALWNHGNQVRALQFTLEVLDKKMDPGIMTYRTLISCLCKDGLVDEAISLLLDMDRTRFGPDYFSYSITIDGLCKHGRVYDAIDLLDVIVEKGCRPKQFTYICLIRAVGLSGLKSDALQLANTLFGMKALSGDSLGQITRFLGE